MTIEILSSLPSALIGAFGALILWQAPRRAWLPAGLLGGICWLIYTLLEQFVCTEMLATFFAVLITCLLAQGMARRMHMISTVFINASVVPCVPGLRLYRFMSLFGAGNAPEGGVVAVEALEVVLMITLGIAVSSYLARVMRHHRNRTA